MDIIKTSKINNDVGPERKTLPLLFAVFMIVMSAACMPTYAADDNNEQRISEQERSQSADTPDSLTEYTDEQISNIKNERVGLSGVVGEVLDPTERSVVEQSGQVQGDSGLTGEYNENYYLLDTLNASLPTLSEPANLTTPLATLEFFQSAVMKHQYDLAAYALNMNLIDQKIQRNHAIELSQRLDFLLSERALCL
ncbi:hypothetical protein [Psychrobacter sp.]|uniref:hypothetical protein n=1 Tax=unclassified Psychrobacter TaxID=196806 RepID=UPI003F9E16C2